MCLKEDKNAQIFPQDNYPTKNDLVLFISFASSEIMQIHKMENFRFRKGKPTSFQL